MDSAPLSGETSLAHRGLLELLRRLVNAASVDQLLQEALRGALELVSGVDAGSILVRKPGGYRYAATQGFDLEPLRGVCLSLERVLAWYGGTLQEAIQAVPRAHRVDLHPTDVEAIKDRMREFHSTLVVPVPVKGELEAILNLDRQSPEPFSPEALELAQELGKSLEVVLRSLRDRERLHQRLHHEEALSRVLASLATFKEADALWAALPHLIVELMPLEQASALRREGEVLRVVGSLDPELPIGYLIPKGVGMSWQALERRQVEFAPLSDPRVHLVGTLDPERHYGAFVPLFDLQGQAIGVMAFYAPQAFAPDDAALLTVLAQNVGNVLSKLEAQAAQTRELRRLEALAQATRALGPAQSAEEVYRRTVEEALRQTGAVSAILSRLSPAEASLEVVAAAGYAAEKAVGRRFYHGEGLAWQVYHNKSPLFIPDASQMSGSQFASGRRSAGAYLGVPLSDPEGQFIGVLSVDTAGADTADRASHLGPDDRYILEALAEVAGVAISRLSALDQAQRQAEDYRSLVQMSAEIETLTDPVEITRRALETLIPLTGFEAGGLYRLAEGSALVPVVQVGKAPAVLQSLALVPTPGIGGALLERMMVQGETLVVEDLEAHLGEQIHLYGGLRAFAAVPLRLGRDVPDPRFIQGFVTLGHFSRPFRPSPEAVALLEAAARRLERALERATHLEEITRTREAALRSLGLGLELRDLETKGHTDRVVALSTALGEQLGFYDLEGLRLGAYLHDLGKLAVPDEILQKPGPLDPAEWEVMKTHAQIGYEMLQGLPFLPQVTLNVVRDHHERWDGSGYPRGLKGEEIPLEARIFAVVDIYDALLHARPYKSAWPPQEVRRELESQAGKTLDAEVVRAFLALLAQPA